MIICRSFSLLPLLVSQYFHDILFTKDYVSKYPSNISSDNFLIKDWETMKTEGKEG